MSIPSTRAQFRDFVLRKLGHEVITINVSSNQIDDRIDEAVNFWQQWCSQGTERQFYKYQVTQQDIQNGYITLPENIIGAIGIFNGGSIEGSAYIFSIRYQIALNDLYTLTSVSMVPYYMAFSQITMLEELLVGQKAIRYNPITNRIYIDMDWDWIVVGQWLIFDCYEVIDPDEYTAMWGNLQLQNLAYAYLLRQWGMNLSKFANIPMVGGVQFNAQQIINEGQAAVEAAENDIKNNFQTPVMPQVG